MRSHELYMKRCLRLAALGLGKVAPNPMVGSVIVFENKVLGEGFHQRHGEAHAEVMAIANVENKELLTSSTLYVNLEPCAHFGKTPPCADLIIENQIKEVVIGMRDPYHQVAGKGIEKLKNAGIEVVENVLSEECYQLNRRFICFHQKKRPYVILKWAQTADGYFSKKESKQNWITNDDAKRLVHRWRSEESAILVGRGTAVVDNPQLNVRYWTGSSPTRVLIDPELKTPLSHNIFNNEAKTLIFNKIQSKEKNQTEWIRMDSEDDLPEILKALNERAILSIIVEGGKKTLERFIQLNLWDEARVLIGDKIWGEGITAPRIGCSPTSRIDWSGTRLLKFFNA